MAASTSTQTRYTVRKPAPRRRPPTRTRPVARPAPGEKIPEWGDLASTNQRRVGRGRGPLFLDRISTTRFALLILALAAMSTLYVGHVHATQDLLADVQQLRRDNLRLHLRHNRLKGDFDRMVGPGVIYDRARVLGLVEDPAYGPTIEME